MRYYKVNGINHTVFDSVEEVPVDITYLEDWRDGHISDWVKTDDGCVIQILRKGSMMKPKALVHLLYQIRIKWMHQKELISIV